MVDADLSFGAPGVPEVEPEAGGEPFVDDLDLDVGGAVSPAGDVREEDVRALLEGFSGAASVVAADQDVPRQWQFDNDELDGLVPPLTRIINRRPRLQEAVRRGDGALVAIYLTQYVSRNVADGREARKAREHDGLDREADRAPGPDRATARGGPGRSQGPGAHPLGARPGGGPTMAPTPWGPTG